VLRLGVLVGLLPVFRECLVVAHTVLVKVPLVTCAVVEECSPPLAPGGGGTAR